ncbi:MAG TPA: chemotaxis protein CheW, partial [Bacteroidales bacterium]|nr:chemotaxis protein CheW [Bacteroidales bacterium]
VIVKKQNKRYAIITDTIIGEYQAVVKPLGKTFSNVPFLSGASLLGDGSIALLIDTDKLWYETATN